MIRRILKLFEGRSLSFWTVASIASVGVLGFLDYVTGNEFGLSLFYLIPVSLTAWYADRRLSVYIAMLSATAWLLADIAAGQHYSHAIFFFWNTLIRFGFFIIVAYLMSELHQAQKTVEALARTDYTTDTVNSRHFHELLEVHLARTHENKHPFTLAYMDMDNFKLVNDRFGHDEGDAVIKVIASELKHLVRGTDIVSRLGGDEFVILLPSVGQREAEVITEKIKARLVGLLGPKYPFLTFSAGVVTYLAAPRSSTETLKIADDLMYKVKNDTKNGIRYLVYKG